MLEIKHLTITKATEVMIPDLSFHVEPGEILTLMGASGTGKSTVLNWLIGELDPVFSAKGELWLNGSRRDRLPIEERRIGILFQDDLLFPHMSVGQNLAFALPERFRGKQARRDELNRALAEAGLADFYDRDTTTLSGGQRARVSLLRALLAEPEALLLDEPFSKLDAALRTQFRTFVFEQITKLGIPTILVTHDPGDVPPAGRVLELNRRIDHA